MRTTNVGKNQDIELFLIKKLNKYKSQLNTTLTDSVFLGQDLQNVPVNYIPNNKMLIVCCFDRLFSKIKHVKPVSVYLVLRFIIILICQRSTN